MTPTRTVESGKTSPTARPSPSPALKVKMASLLSKCKSQSLIEPKKTRYSSSTNARGKNTRHQSVSSIRTAQHGPAAPTEDLNHDNAIVRADRYSSNPGDHSPKTSNTTETKRNSKATSEYSLGHESQMSATLAADQMPSDCHERQGDKNPSTSSLMAIVQVAKHRCLVNPQAGHPHDSINWSSSSTGLETTWPSLSSDNSYKGERDRKRYSIGQPKTSRRLTASFDGSCQSLANLKIKCQGSSPIKAPLPRKIASTGNTPKKKLISSNIGVNSLKSLTSTALAHKVETGPVCSRSVSPVKTSCKLALSPKLKKKDVTHLSPADSWDSLSPRCNSRRNQISSSEKNALPHSALKHTDISEAGRSGSPDITKVSASTVDSVGRQRFKTKRENTHLPKRKLSFSPSVEENVKASKTQQIKINRSLRNNSSIGPRMSTNMHFLKMNKTNRSDRSTDSGYQESVSRATLDWFTALGLVTGEKSGLKRQTDSTANVDSRFDPPTNFSNGSPLSTQTAVYSTDEQNRSCHSPASTQTIHSTDDGRLDTRAIQTTDEAAVQINQQNKTRCYFVGELQKVSSRHPQTSEMVGNSDQTFEQISESALAIEMVEDDASCPQAGNADGALQDVHSIAADTFCVSDTCGIVSDILDNNSDITDISADWDIGPSFQEISREALKSPKMERFARRDAFQQKEPKSYKKHSLHKSPLLSTKGSKTSEEVFNFELGASPETSIREESSMQELSYSPSFLARGFNSNTRRTVEINYDLIAMNDTSRMPNGNTPTFSDRPGSRISQRSLSEPSRNPSATQSLHGKSTPSDLSVGGDVVRGSSSSTTRSRLRLLTFSQALDHCYWSNMASAINRYVAPFCRARIPEPKLFYIGCLSIVTMCLVLAFILTYLIIG